MKAATVLVCAGLDPSGRAGLLADFEALAGRGARGVGVATALTVQSESRFVVRAVLPPLVQEQIQMVRALGPVGAVKLGMVPNRRTLFGMGAALATFRGWRVIDPVTRTSRGEKLSSLARGDYLGLAGARAILTPNIMELAWLLGRSWIPQGEAPTAAGELVRRGFAAVVVKGGHAEGPPIDWVVTVRGATAVSGRRVRQARRGTGCRFASALAADLAKGRDLVTAVRAAKRFVASYLTR